MPKSLFAMMSIMMFAEPTLAQNELLVEGGKRSYHVHVPIRVVPRPPLIIALHPRPASGRAMAHISGFNSVADREGFVVAYPDGINGGWDILSDCSANKDIKFVSQLIDKLAHDHNVDPDRIYLAGVSNGARMAFRLTDDSPRRFAAIAAVSGLPRPSDSVFPTFPKGRSAVPLIAFLGGRDPDHPGHWLALARWKIRFECQTVSADLPSPATMRMRSICGSPDSPLMEYHFNEGHVWPGAQDSGPLSWPDAPFKAAELIWSFFETRRLNPGGRTGKQVSHEPLCS